MVRKKMEGDEDQRRAAALEAEREGERPSERGETTGASKQRHHVSHRSTLTHEDKTAPIHRGKQQQHETERVNEAHSQTTGHPPREAPPSEPSFTGRGDPGYTAQHERVFEAVAVCEQRHPGEPASLDEVAATAGVPADETRALLHDLVSRRRLLTATGDERAPDDPHYQVKHRL